MVSRLNENWRGPCEVSVGVETRSGQPLIVTCGEPGTLHGGGPFGTVLCPKHSDQAARISEQWKRAAEMQNAARKIRKAAKRSDA